ncbi:MAG: response regulator, partial [Chthoniobacteraceae bacterium]
ASRGHAAIALAREYLPAGILLDISLPDMDGWKVLDRLKSDLATRHIPIYVISVADEPQTALKQGALRFVTKPISKEEVDELMESIRTFRDKPRRLLVIEDDELQRDNILDLIGNGTSTSLAVGTGKEAQEALASDDYTCVILDLMLPDISGFELIKTMRREHPELPILVYTAKDLTRDEEEQLNRVAQTIIVKDVRSPERLYDQTALWLHKEVAALPDDKRAMLTKLHKEETVLAGKKVLLVDDDVRNIFAMTSVLERFQMNVIPAETGQAALKLLQENPDVDVALMDIMLPEMDGYQVMREIRGMFDFKTLPIIALTAKAMKGDREKCIEAGASDYVAKPVDTEKLISVLRMWLHR